MIEETLRNDVSLTIRIHRVSPELVQAFQDECRIEQRSMSGQLGVILRDWVENRRAARAAGARFREEGRRT